MAAPSPVVLRFNNPVALVDAQSAITLHDGEASGSAVSATMALAPDGKGVILTPQTPLQAHQTYTLVVDHLALSGGTLNKTLSFTTRALQKGPKSLVVEDSDFGVARHFPDNSTQQPVMDFSTFRLQFTQPIDPSTAHYGANPTDSIKLVDQNGDLVDATLIVDGPYMTIDPKPDYLNAGQKYTLTLGTGLTSTYGEALPQADDIKFTPKDSTPNGGAPAVLVQYITDSQNGSVLSPLSGQPVNEVAVKGTLLGNNGINKTQASAVVHAELADPVTYTNVLPIRIPKGTVLSGSSIDVKIGGVVDAGYDSGKVTMTLLSDATGTMVLNPYSHQSDAPRIVHLFMDVGITTEDPRANGGFTQDILHIELVGTSKVDTQAGVLDLDAISVVQPNILGQEYGYAVLSFQLKSYRDQTQVPAEVADTTAPTVQSWMPGDNVDLQKPGDPIIINFDEPLDQQSVAGQVTLTRTDNSGTQEQDIAVTVDGAAIVIKPKTPLVYSEETNAISYELKLGDQLTDVMGNKFAGSFDKTFSLPTTVQQRYEYNEKTNTRTSAAESTEVHSPIILGLYPGFPCALDPSTRDLAHGFQGRCKGSIPKDQSGLTCTTEDDQTPNDPNTCVALDDLLPILPVPGRRPIMVSFSKKIDPTSVALGKTFVVQHLNADGSVANTVLGDLKLEDNDTILVFTPGEPWQNGELYRYTLKSNGDIHSSVADCNPDSATPSICGAEANLPIQTQLLTNLDALVDNPGVGIGNADYSWWVKLGPVSDRTDSSVYDTPDPNAGGPDLAQYFKGAQASDDVFQMLRTAPISDTNANLISDRNRHATEDYPGGFFPPISWGKMNFYSYDQEESGPKNQTDDLSSSMVDPYTGYPLDPEGVRSAPNSAKVLSRHFGIDSLSYVPNIFPDFWATGALTFGNVGCGFSGYREAEDQTGCDVASGNFFNKVCYVPIPATCPMDKFTYLSSTLFGQVTQNYDPDKGLEVQLYPGHVLGTSFLTVLNRGVDEKNEIGPSGIQVLRMRYQENEDGNRTQPIIGYINPDENGNPVFSATVDLYLNAPHLVDFLSRVLLSVSHNLYSYPIHMRLSGPVTFLNDGRMVISQYNLEPINVSLRAQVPIIYADLVIPKKGSYLQYISQPIK